MTVEKRALGIFAALFASWSLSANGAVVINEIYGGGGNANAPFNQDFVELFNNGLTAVDISGDQLLYGSATGNFGTFATVPMSTSLAAGSFYTVSAGVVGSTGAAVPGIDLVGGLGTNISAANGKVELLSGTSVVLDLVGFGTANEHEGLGDAPAGSNTASLQRIPDGVDTDNNNVDFQARAPTPDAINLPVPEPATPILIGIGLVIAGQCFRRKV